MNEIRDEFLRHSLVPRQSMLDFVSIRKLSVGKVVVQRVPKDWRLLKEFAETLGMPWAGQGLPSVSQAALLFFLRPKREPCRKHYETLEQKRGGGCAECGREDTLEVDHIHPISADPFGRNDIENLQLLCAECHEQKTVAQAWREPFNPLLSYFNEHVWSNFVLSARIPQTVCRYNRLDTRAPMQVVVAIRCRRQLLAHLSP